jgi:hypothetical protein
VKLNKKRNKKKPFFRRTPGAKSTYELRKRSTIIKLRTPKKATTRCRNRQRRQHSSTSQFTVTASRTKPTCYRTMPHMTSCFDLSWKYPLGDCKNNVKCRKTRLQQPQRRGNICDCDRAQKRPPAATPFVGTEVKGRGRNVDELQQDPSGSSSIDGRSTICHSSRRPFCQTTSVRRDSSARRDLEPSLHRWSPSSVS